MEEFNTRETLLIKIRDPGDNRAWEEFADLYTPLIYRFCASRGVAASDIADVTQDTMRSVASAIQRFEYDADKGKFRTWLFRVTWSKIARHFEKKNKQVQGTGRSTVLQMLEETPSEKSEADWDLEYRKQMFDWAAEKVKPEFEEKTWKAFWQSTVAEEPGVEVAKSLGMTPSAVYVAKSRVIARLRACVAAVAGEFDLPELA